MTAVAGRRPTRSRPGALVDVEIPFEPGRAGRAGRYAVLGAVAAVVLLYGTSSPDAAAYATTAAVYAMVGLSLNILIGYTGQLSLGHQGFLGIGALVAAYTVTVLELPFGVALLAGLAAGAGLSLLLGFVALRISGLYLAVITLVVGLTLQDSVFRIGALSGGGAGQPANRPTALLDNSKFFLFCLVTLAVVVYFDVRLTRSKTGRALLALKENERVAAAFGINVTAFKLLAFVLAGAVVGLAGALDAFRSQQFSGENYSFLLALTFVIMTVVGGAGSRVGVIVGSAFFAIAKPLFSGISDAVFGPTTNSLVQNLAQFGPDAVGALLLLLTLIFNPGGIAQQLAPLTRWLAGERFRLHSDSDSGPGAVEGSSVRA